MRTHTFLLATLALASFVLAAPAHAQAPPDTSRTSDPKAIAIAERVIGALGGKDRWESLNGLRWSFESARHDTVLNVRRHSWDKRSGWHRVSGKTRDGLEYVFIDNIHTGEGRAWMGGNEIQGDSLRTLLRRAKSLWTNDTYWMLMPYKLRDPGVVLKHAGTMREGDYVFDKLALSFDQVGETPGDRYWVYVNQASHRVEKWEYVLQGQEPPPAAWTWEGWEQRDGLWFPTAKRNAEGRAIFTRQLEMMSAFPEAEFKQP